MKVGIDYSMTCPAIYVQRDDGSEKWYVIQEVLKLVQENELVSIERHPKYTTKMERAIHLANWAMNILRAEGVTELNMESFAMAASGTSAIFDTAAHTAILYQKLYEAGIVVNFIPPTTAKKYFTSKGNANKEAMCEKFFELRGWRFSDKLGSKINESPENDMVDAYAICLCDVRLDAKAKTKMFF